MEYKRKHKYADTTKKAGKHTVKDLYTMLESVEDELIEAYEEIEKKDNCINELNKELRTIKKDVLVSTTEESLSKEILRLYAQGKSSGTIYKYLSTKKGIDVSPKRVSSILMTLEANDLDATLIKYYHEQKEAYKEEFSFDEEDFRKTKLRQLDEMQNALSIAIQEKIADGGDLESALKLFQELRSSIKDTASLMKGIGSTTEINIDAQAKEAEKIRNKLEDQSRGLLQGFDPSSLNAVN